MFGRKAFGLRLFKKSSKQKREDKFIVDAAGIKRRGTATNEDDVSQAVSGGVRPRFGSFGDFSDAEQRLYFKKDWFPIVEEQSEKKSSKKEKLKESYAFDYSPSPIVTDGLLSSVKSLPLTYTNRLSLKEELGMQSVNNYALAADVLRALAKTTAQGNKEIAQMSESDVVHSLLEDISNFLTVPFAYDAFVAFAKTEFTDELVRFHKDVGDLSRKYHELIPIDDATDICNRYIVEGGEEQINLSGPMREAIVTKVEKEARVEGRYVDAALFDSALLETQSLLEEQTFRRFKDVIKKSMPYAKLVWGNSLSSVLDAKVDASYSISLFKFFMDVQEGLNTLKRVVQVSREPAPFKPTYQEPLYSGPSYAQPLYVEPLPSFGYDYSPSVATTMMSQNFIDIQPSRTTLRFDQY